MRERSSRPRRSELRSSNGLLPREAALVREFAEGLQRHEGRDPRRLLDAVRFPEIQIDGPLTGPAEHRTPSPASSWRTVWRSGTRCRCAGVIRSALECTRDFQPGAEIAEVCVKPYRARANSPRSCAGMRRNRPESARNGHDLGTDLATLLRVTPARHADRV